MKKSMILLCLLALLCASSAVAADLTTIRQVGKAEGLWGSQGSQHMLGGAKVTVRNVGRVEARNVRVSVQVTGLGSFNLNGPQNLRPNQRETYSAKIMKYVAPNAKLKADISCENCR